MLSHASSKKASRVPLGPSLSQPAPRTPPTDPLPPNHPRPADVLIARLNELKRLVKSFAAHYSALAAAEEAHGRALQALAQGEAIRLPWLEQSLFMPYSGAEAGQGGHMNGWARVQARIKDGSAKDADGHLELAKMTNVHIVEPLKRIHIGIKAFIADLDQQLNTLAVDVVKERETSVERLKHLVASVATYTAAPLNVPATEDPLILRSTAEQQMRKQVARENELLRATLTWQDMARDFEIELFDRVGACWKTWEETTAECSGASQARVAEVGKLVDALPNSAEWEYFTSLNYLVPSTTPARDLDFVDYPERNHPATKPVKEGVLERRKRVVKNWKEAYFVLSPAGYLHEYPTASTPLSSPSTSLFLPNCTITPLTEPSLGSKAGRDKPASFSVEGRKSFGLHHRETGGSYRARSYAEAQEWWTAISQLTESAQTAHEGGGAYRAGAGPAAHAVSHAGMPAFVQHEGAEMSADEEDDGRSGEATGTLPQPSGVRGAGDQGKEPTTIQAAEGSRSEHIPAQAAQTATTEAAPGIAATSHRREPGMPGGFVLDEVKSDVVGSSTSQQVQPVADAAAFTASPAAAGLPLLEKQTAAPVMRDTPAVAPLALAPKGPTAPATTVPTHQASALLAPSSPVPPGTTATAWHGYAYESDDEPQMSVAVPAFLAAGQLPDPAARGVGAGAGAGAATEGVGRGTPSVPQGTLAKERRRSSWLRFGKKDKK